MAPSPFSWPHPWLVLSRDGAETLLDTRAEWVAEWRHRIEAIVEADRPVAHRRAGLERMLSVNSPQFCRVILFGVLDAVLEVTALVTAADGRLSALADVEGEKAA